MKETHLREGRQTIKLAVQKVAKDLFPDDEFWTVYSIVDGVYCCLKKSSISVREVKQIEFITKEWLAGKPEIIFLGKQEGYFHYKLDDHVIKTIYKANTDTTFAEAFRLIPFGEGFISDHSVHENGFDIELQLPELLNRTYRNNHSWLRKIDIEMVSDLNKYINDGRQLELQNMAEALQEKQIAAIADEILAHRRSLRVILISGPSSSGKTSFAQRLSTQLRINGLKPVPLSLDNYFVNREDNPLDSDGHLDFETIDALDLPYLQDQVKKIVKGEYVETPLFDFVTGSRQKETLPMQLGPTEVLLLEGIHSLNPKLLPNIDKGSSFKIYVSALFGLNVDFFNRTPTTEVRLLRRMVRDGRDRGVNPEQTLERWASVRSGETNFVFRHQEEADVMFNSSLLYELNAIRPFAERLLNQIADDSPYCETKERLLNLLSFYQPIEVSKVPFNSILREFIGGSLYFHK